MRVFRCLLWSPISAAHKGVPPVRQDCQNSTPPPLTIPALSSLPTLLARLPNCISRVPKGPVFKSGSPTTEEADSSELSSSFPFRFPSPRSHRRWWFLPSYSVDRASLPLCIPDPQMSVMPALGPSCVCPLCQGRPHLWRISLFYRISL